MGLWEYESRHEAIESLQTRKADIFSILNTYPSYRGASLKAFENTSQFLEFTIGKTLIRLVNDRNYLFLQTQTPTRMPNHFDSWVIAIGDKTQITHKVIRHEGTDGIVLGGIPVETFTTPDDPKEALEQFAESLKKSVVKRRVQVTNQPAVA